MHHIFDKPKKKFKDPLRGITEDYERTRRKRKDKDRFKTFEFTIKKRRGKA